MLVSITNSCDRAGTIANELPIVEQIPVLHRLDHSVHTMRLWAATRAKELCSDWNTKMFFRVVHNDIFNCLEHLNDLRMPGETLFATTFFPQVYPYSVFLVDSKVK